MYPQSMFWSKNKKNYENFSPKNVQFLKLKNYLYIAWAIFRNGHVIYHCLLRTVENLIFL